MDCSYGFFKKIFKGRSPNDEVNVRWSSLHLSIFHHYLRDISKICDFRDLYIFTFSYRGSGESRVIKGKIAASLMKDIRDVFMVPRLNEFDESQNQKHQLLEAFISFLLQLLCHKTGLMIDLCRDQIEYLEKELRFLTTIHGDVSLMVVGDERVQLFLKGFEAVANEAGYLVYSLLFTEGLGVGKMKESLRTVLDDIDSLKANARGFVNSLSSTSATTCMITLHTSVMKSFLIAGSLVEHLEDIMGLEDSLTADVKDQISTLHQGLTFLQSSIKNKVGLSRSSEENGELREALMRIGDMANGAEYLIISFFFGEAPLWCLVNRLTDISRKIQLISTDVLEIMNRHRIGGAEVAAHDLSLQAKKNLEVDDVTVGFEDKVTHILDKLLGGNKTQLQVVSIVGMPGLGKTTLARKLYIHSSVKYWFDKLSWCVISQIYETKNTMTNILIQIASHLQKDDILQMEEERLAENIYKTLIGRRYLIVIDDIWDSNVWDELWRCFPNDANGSRILLTTRNRDVAPPDSIIYALPSLSKDQCWELLEKKVFDYKPCPTELMGIGKKIAENCGGLPLAVVVIAGILSTMDKKESKWKEAEKNLSSYIFYDGDDTVMRILELSYKHLPEYLKPCFLYFGAFDEDKEIPIRHLTRLWIAEGLIHKVAGKTADRVAEEYLKELIDKSLVMVAKRRSDGGVKTCIIHDLLRDLCLKRSKEEKFLKFVDKKDFENRDYSTYEKGHRLVALEEFVSWKYFDYVGSFRFINYPISPRFYFRHSRFLRVLHCSYLETQFIRIEYAVCLRYLVIGYLPAEIGSLVNLEYLVVDTRSTVYLPPAILKMNKLRCILVGSEAIYSRDCSNSSQANNLEFLSRVVIDEPKDEEVLKLSPRMRKLKLSTRGNLDISFLTHLESLNAQVKGSKKMSEISFPSNIKKLTLSGKFELPGEKMSMIGRLKNIQVLKLRSVSFEDRKWDAREGEFQKLRFLQLDNIKYLTQWNVDSSEHFPKLERLILRDCHNLEEIPCGVGDIGTLEMIEVRGRCAKSLVESAKSIQQEQMDIGNEELRVIISVERDFWHSWK